MSGAGELWTCDCGTCDECLWRLNPRTQALQEKHAKVVEVGGALAIDANRILDRQVQPEGSYADDLRLALNNYTSTSLMEIVILNLDTIKVVIYFALKSLRDFMEIKTYLFRAMV